MQNKNLAISIIFVLIFGIAGWAFTQGSQGNKTVGGSALGERYYLNAGSGSVTDAGQQTATTTRVYLATSATASSTVVGQMDRADQLDVQVAATASTSAAILRLVVETSNNLIDFFPVSEATGVTVSPLAETAIESPHTFALATTTTTGNTLLRHFVIRGPYAKYFRIRVGVTGANAAVWMAVTPKENVPN